MLGSHSWKRTTIGQIAKLATGTTPPSKSTKYFGGDIQWYTPQDIMDQLYLGPSTRTLTEVARTDGKARLFDEGTILLTAIGNLGRVGILSHEASANQQITGITLMSEQVEREYLFFWLLGNRRELFMRASQATLPIINQAKIREVPISYPTVSEQRRIVARIKECMERVEEIENLRAEAIEEAKATLPSMLNETFVELGANYGEVEIGEVTIETRYGTSRKCASEPKGIAILRIPNVAGGFVNFEKLKYCPLEKKELNNIVLQKGDLLFVRTNGSRDLVGRCAIFEVDGNDQPYGFASYLIRVRLDQAKMRPHFLAFFLNSTLGRTELDKRRRTSAGQFNINSENLRSIKVPLPPLDVQERLVEALRDRQSQVGQLQNELYDANETESHLRESILRKAFAGEL